MKQLVYLTIFTLFFLSEWLMAQNTGRLQPIPNVYLDCRNCDITYIRTNTTFVNYVRDQDDADIYLNITDQRTGGGGREFTLAFNGLKHFEGKSDTLRYISSSTDSGDERRFGLNRHIKIGLVPYVSKTVAMQSLDIFYDEPEEAAETDVDEFHDPWNNWVFDINARSWMSGEKSKQDFSFFGGLFAERITDQWKIRMRARGEAVSNRVELSDGSRTNTRNWGEFWGLYGYSISDHASVGLFTRSNFSTFNNIRLNLEASPAFEYNLFPYDDFSERRFLFLYRITPSYRNYLETTIFNRDSELLVNQSLSIQIRFDRRWGRFDTNLSGSHFFHDTSLNRLNFNTSLNLRIIRGLSVSLSGRYSLINDQLSLRRGDLSDEEVLLGLQQQATSFNYGASIGLNYTFGSAFNNIVNPRF